MAISSSFSLLRREGKYPNSLTAVILPTLTFYPLPSRERIEKNISFLKTRIAFSLSDS
jgi:hypothetical protein